MVCRVSPNANDTSADRALCECYTIPCGAMASKALTLRVEEKSTSALRCILCEAPYTETERESVCTLSIVKVFLRWRDS